MTHADVVVQVLGTPTLVLPGRTAPFPPGRPGRLLALLLLARGRVVPADRLVDQVWGEDLPEDARATLHTTVARTRRALGPAGSRLQRQAAGYRFDLSSAVVDADVFLDRLHEARAGETVEGYDAALSAWHGDPWAPWAEDLARGEALQLREAYVAAREERARLLLGAGRVTEAVGELQVLVAEQPLRDRPVALLMEALHRTGAAAEALAVFSRHRDHLADELGLDPSPELSELQRQVLQREPAAAAASTPATSQTSARDVGAAPARASRPATGPQAPAMLYGRDRDLADLRSLMAMHRVVTLVGPGGVGKTTLAVRATNDEPSTWWVDLATVSGEAGVRAVTASALSVESFPGGTPEAALRHRLASVEGVLVLDNCEHVVGPVADLVAEVLHSGAGLRVLATSRERLGLPEEHVSWLPPLELPPPDRVDLGVASVALFLDRARAASPDLAVDEATAATVSALVRTLDGLPLAIELAASRVGVVSLDALQRRLEGRLDLLQRHHRRGPARHQTLTATIEWSYDLLSEDEQRAFRWLSGFAGPFGLDDAETLLGPGSVEAVIALVERSLLVRPGTRHDEYRMLETLRHFARSRLDEEEAELAAAAHADWAASFASAACAAIATEEEAAWHELIERRLPDLARAVRWSVDTGELSVAAGVVTGLVEWAYLRVRVDVLAWSRDVVDHPTGRGQTPGAWAAASSHAWMLGRHDLAAEYAERGIAAAGGTDRPDSLLAVQAAADTALAVGDLDRAHDLCRRAHATASAHGDRGHQLIAASSLVLARVFQGRPCEQELQLLRAAMPVGSPGLQALGLYAEAEALTDTEPERALRLLTEARARGESVHARLSVGVALAAETALRGRVGALDADTVHRTVRAVEHWLGSGNENLFVTCLRNVVTLLDRFGAHRAGVRLAAATEAHTPDRPPYGAEKQRLDLALQRARAVLPEEDFDAAWQEGSVESLEDAARRAVDDLHGLV